jgi:pyruvate kinase
MAVALGLPVRRAFAALAVVVATRTAAAARPQRPGIIATLGPSAKDPATIRRMVRAGMDVARINLSHADARATRTMVSALREAAAAEGRAVPILFDLPGGKLRTTAGGVLRAGRAFTLTPELVGRRDFASHVGAGDRVLLADGALELEVTGVKGDRVATRVVRGGTFRPKTGLAIAGKELPFPAMTSLDRKKLAIAVANGAGWIGVSMTQGARHVHAVRRALDRLGATHVKIVAKVESASGLERLDEILDASDAVMIARGDLGQVVGAELPKAQALIAARARARGKPFIAATNFLSAMLSGHRPSAANLDDIAIARSQGPAWFMLNETAIAKRPVATVRAMRRALSAEP